MTRGIDPKILKIVVLNALACALLLFADVHVRDMQGMGYLPDAVTLAVFVLLFVMASTSTLVFRVVAIALLLLNVLYLHTAKAWGPLKLSDRIEVAMQAPAYEAWEYLREYVGMREVKILLYALMCLAAILVAGRIVGIGRKAGVAALVLAAGLCVLSYRLAGPSRDTHPYTAFPLAYADASARRARIGNRATAIEKARQRTLDCTQDYRNVLIVIGESASRKHMSLYGYAKQTTPFLQSIQPAAFAALAPTNQTRLSLPLMLSGARVQRFDEFYSLHSMVSDFRACGFETFWISNQGETGQHDSSNTSIGKEADHAHLRDNNLVSEPDEVLLPQLRAALAGGSGRKAIFVHLMGSHLVYWGRYPKSFPKGEVRGLLAEYDESIRYTDYVLSQMYGLFPREGLLFLYVSDHAERVHDSVDPDFRGHGFSPAYKAEYEVPLVVWSSAPARLQNVVAYANGRQMNMESFDDVVRYLMGIGPLEGISFSRQVLEVSETAIVDFDRLKD